MPVTIGEVAARAGVSKTTVSRVLNGKGELDAATAARVRQVIEELGYVPSARAVGLARGKTRVVGMLVPSVTWPWMSQVLQGAIDVLEDAGYGLMLFTCSRGERSMRSFASRASAQSFDGLLAIEPEESVAVIAELHAHGLPVVMIDDRASGTTLPCVCTDNRGGGASAAQHLLELGRRRPLVLCGPEHFGCTRDRLEGFAEVFARAGSPLDPRLVTSGEFTFNQGEVATTAALRAGLPFDAVFAHNDLSAGGAVRALRGAGRSVPGDVAVVGFDDVAYANQVDPPLTTVSQPMRELGTHAARLLIAHFGGEPLGSAPTVLPTTLVIRSSTVADPR